MFEKNPLFQEVSLSNLEAYRRAKRDAARAEGVSDAQIEHELAELDAALLGTTAAELEARPESGTQQESQDEKSGVMTRPR